MLILKGKYFKEFSGHNSVIFELGTMVASVHILITYHKGALPLDLFFHHFNHNDFIYLVQTNQITLKGEYIYIGSTDLIGNQI